MVRGRFAVPMQICRFSLLFIYSNKNDISLDSQMEILYNNMNYGNVGTELDMHDIHGAKTITFGTLIVDGHLEGTVSQIFYLGPSFHFMKSRKLS